MATARCKSKQDLTDLGRRCYRVFRLDSHPRIQVSRNCLHDICSWVPTRFEAWHELLCKGSRRTIRCAQSTYVTQIKTPSQPMRSHHDYELVCANGVIDLVAHERSRGGNSSAPNRAPTIQNRIQDDTCVPQASIATIDLLDDGPCEVCAHKGLVSSRAMLGQVSADALSTTSWHSNTQGQDNTRLHT